MGIAKSRRRHRSPRTRGKKMQSSSAFTITGFGDDGSVADGNQIRHHYRRVDGGTKIRYYHHPQQPTKLPCLFFPLLLLHLLLLLFPFFCSRATQRTTQTSQGARCKFEKGMPASDSFLPPSLASFLFLSSFFPPFLLLRTVVSSTTGRGPKPWRGPWGARYRRGSRGTATRTCARWRGAPRLGSAAHPPPLDCTADGPRRRGRSACHPRPA